MSYFIAKANCKHPGCSTFKFTIKRKPKKPYHSVQVDVTVTKNIIPHRPGEMKKRNLLGQKRREAQKRLKTDAATRIHYTEFSKMKKEEIERKFYQMPIRTSTKTSQNRLARL